MKQYNAAGREMIDAKTLINENNVDYVTNKDGQRKGILLPAGRGILTKDNSDAVLDIMAQVLDDLYSDNNYSVIGGTDAIKAQLKALQAAI